MAGDDRQRRPAEGLVGAHDQRRDALVDGPDPAWVEQDRDDLPFTSGAEVAPTAKAARDQRARHRAEGSSARIAARLPGKKARARPSTARDARAAPGAGVARAKRPAAKKPGKPARGAAGKRRARKGK